MPASNLTGKSVSLTLGFVNQLGRTRSESRGGPGRIGREINPHVFSPQEISRRRQEHDHFLASVLDAPRLFIVGTEDELGEVG